jgi:hypothetical protein
MKFLKYIATIFVFSIFNTQAIAGDFGGQTICALQMDTNGRAVLQPCDAWIAKNSCANNGWVEWYENEGQGGGKGMHAIALAAMVSNKTVMLRIGNDCSGQWDHLTAIRIHK